jgi:hypothetical protein
MNRATSAWIAAAVALGWWMWLRKQAAAEPAPTLNTVTNIDATTDTPKTLKEILALLASNKDNATTLNFLGDGFDLQFSTVPWSELPVWNGVASKGQPGLVPGQPWGVDGAWFGGYNPDGSVKWIPWSIVPPKPGSFWYERYLQGVADGTYPSNNP